ncbi:MAG: anti-sigma factor [Dehalococcoidia bacterium]
MTCEDVQDLLPGYMLDALDEHEAAEVEAHLATCREHDEELVELRATGMALALLDDAPSAQLRDRVRAVPGPMPLYAFPDSDGDLDDLLDDGVDLEDDELDAAARDGRVTPLRSRPVWGAGWWSLGAVAAIAIVMFGAGWFAGVRSAPEAQQAVRYSYEMRSPTGQLVRFAGIEGTDRVTVTMDGIEALPEGRQYQVWAIRDGKWLSLGSCNTNAKGWWRGDFEFTLKSGEEVALTVEPTGGSPKPSTPAILRTKL